jgi:uroporphyrinogen decarboxylase
MTKRERVETVIAGETPDQVPVSFWHHFEPEEFTGRPALDAHVKHLERFDLDFLKVMNDHQFPRGDVPLVATVSDLKRIRPLPGRSGDFVGQLELLGRLREALGDDVPMTTTIFNPWAVLRKLVEPPSDEHGPPKMHGEDARDDALTELLKQDRAAVKGAIEAIGETVADFAGACIEAGADGIFLSVRDDWVDRHANGTGTYDEFVRDVDLKILEAAAAGTFNMLHICGRPLEFQRFAEYPVQVLNWADREAGPSIAYARDRVKPAIAGGVNNLGVMADGSPEDCAAEALDALRQAKDRPIMITPGCTYDPKRVPEANLRAVVEAARRCHY